jgi:hypothetical protein
MHPPLEMVKLMLSDGLRGRCLQQLRGSDPFQRHTHANDAHGDQSRDSQVYRLLSPHVLPHSQFGKPP